MSDTPAVDVTAQLRAADDQAAAEAHSDAWATATYYGTLLERGVPADLAEELVKTWLESYLDQCSDDE